MLRIAKSFHSASAHRLYREDWDERKNIDVFGKCYRLHGHNYKFTVEVGGDVDPDTAMVLNYYELTSIIDRIIVQKWDHQYINDLPDFQDFKLLTTAENMVMVAKRLIDPQFHGTPYYLTELTLQVSERTYARWIRIGKCCKHEYIDHRESFVHSGPGMPGEWVEYCTGGDGSCKCRTWIAPDEEEDDGEV